MVCTPSFIMIISDKRNGIFSAILKVHNNHFLCSISDARILSLLAAKIRKPLVRHTPQLFILRDKHYKVLAIPTCVV
jgi:hypothetical protein